MDGGATWIQRMDKSSITTMIIDPQDSKIMYAGSDQGTVFKTTNRGTDWDRIQPGLLVEHITAITIDSRDHNTVYVGTLFGKVHKTTDGGRQWSSSQLPRSSSINTLANDPLYPNTVYAGTYNGVIKTEDGGVSWVIDNMGLGTNVVDHGQVFSIVIDPRPSKAMYAAAGIIGAFKRVHEARP